MIDARIPLMVNPLQIEPRANALARVMQLQAMQGDAEMRRMQLQQIQQAMQEQARQRQAEEQRRQSVRGYLGSLNSNAGPARPFNPVEALQVTEDPQLTGQLASVFAAPKRPAPIKVAPGESLVDPETSAPLYQAPERPEKMDPNKPFMLDPATGQPVPNKAYQDYQQSVARAGASSVSVNTGQRGLDNTLKLRGDFHGEPVYKAHQEMQSAYGQIKQSLQQDSPAGDLAGATKLMKLLDPGSVVRESELGMAMAASGLLDRVVNYADMIKRGTKLTPTQRKDFQSLADALFNESVKAYNAKRSEYEGIARRNNLPVEDVLGPSSVAAPTRPPAGNKPASGANPKFLGFEGQQ